MHLNRRQFIAASSMMAAAATSAGGLEKKKYKACIIGDSKMGGYGHCIQPFQAVTASMGNWTTQTVASGNNVLWDLRLTQWLKGVTQSCSV